MALKIEMVQWENLSEELKKDHGLSKDDYDDYLIVKHNGKVIAFHSDRMEPEDVRFYRDLSWIHPLLEEVYELGKQDAKNEKES